MPDAPDYYDLLGITPAASDEEVNAGYRRAAAYWHPDRNKSPNAQEMMRHVNNARDVLLDPAKRREYNQRSRVFQAQAQRAAREERERRAKADAERAAREWMVTMTTGRARAMDEKYCVSCGKPIPETALFCSHCGTSQNPAGQPPPPHYAAPSPNPQQPGYSVHGRNKWIAAVLAFFLGQFGIHKFYLGKTGQGILYLLFFWAIIPGIIAFIEFIIYLLTPENVFRAKYPYS